MAYNRTSLGTVVLKKAEGILDDSNIADMETMETMEAQTPINREQQKYGQTRRGLQTRWTCALVPL